MSKYLCKEGTEEFYIEADSLQQARDAAVLFNAVVIRKV